MENNACLRRKMHLYEHLFVISKFIFAYTYFILKKKKVDQTRERQALSTGPSSEILLNLLVIYSITL